MNLTVELAVGGDLFSMVSCGFGGFVVVLWVCAFNCGVV